MNLEIFIALVVLLIILLPNLFCLILFVKQHKLKKELRLLRDRPDSESRDFDNIKQELKAIRQQLDSHSATEKRMGEQASGQSPPEKPSPVPQPTTSPEPEKPVPPSPVQTRTTPGPQPIQKDSQKENIKARPAKSVTPVYSNRQTRLQSGLRIDYKSSEPRRRIAKEESKAEFPSSPDPVSEFFTNKLMPFLRQAGLWPPAELKGQEAGMIQWLAPRIGGFFGILAILWLAVYVVQDASPMIRFFELLAADLAVLGLGAFFIKREKSFGQVILGSGLVMLYVTAIAAYAIRPVRIIESPILGVIVQMAAVFILFSAGLKLTSRPIVLLGLVFGYFTGLFGAWEGLAEGALLCSLVLYVASIAFHRRFAWRPLLSVGVFGIYLPVLLYPVITWFKTPVLPEYPLLLGYLAVSVSLFPLADILRQLTLSERDYWHRILHSFNTSAALLSGYLFAKFFDGSLLYFYGYGAILFSGWAVTFGRRDMKSLGFHLYFVKGSALASLWMVNYFEGDIRWFALFVQLAVIAATARRNRSVWLEATGFILLATATVFMLDQYRAMPELWSFAWWLYATTPILAITSLSYQRKVFPENSTSRRVFHSLANMLLVFIAFWVIVESDINKDVRPVWLLIYAGILASATQIKYLQKGSLIQSAAVLFVLAQLQFWVKPYSLFSLVVLLLANGAVITLVIKLKTHLSVRKSYAAESALHIFWLTCLVAWLARFYEHSFYLLLAPGLWLVLQIAARKPLKALADWCWLPMILYIFEPVSRNLDVATFWPVSTLLICMAGVVIPVFIKERIEQFSLLRESDRWAWLGHGLLALWMVHLLPMITGWNGINLITCAVILFLFSIWYRGKLKASLVMLLSLAVFVFIRLALLKLDENMGFKNELPWSWEYLTSGFCLLATLLILVIYQAKRLHPDVSRKDATALGWFLSAGVYLTGLVTLTYSEYPWTQHFTWMLAIFCVFIIIMGIAFVVKSLRVVGAAGLVYPIARLFLIDVHNPLHRIIAFASLAVLLTFIGWLYYKFKSRIGTS